MNKLSESYHYTVDSKNNVKLELSRSTPTKTLTDSPSYYSQGWDTLLLDDCSPLGISNGRALWESWLSNAKHRVMQGTLSALGHKWLVYETPLPTADVFPSSLLTTEKIGVDVPKGSTNPGVTMTSTTCSSLSGGVSGSPIVNRGSLPTDSIASTAGVRSPATDSLMEKSKGGGCRVDTIIMDDPYQDEHSVLVQQAFYGRLMDEL